MMSEDNKENLTNLSDPSILRGIGASIKALRLKRNLTQEAIALRAGLDRTTIVQLEKGRAATLLTFVQVLRVLERLNVLAALREPVEISPLDVADVMEKTRKRASAKTNARKSKTRKPKASPW